MKQTSEMRASKPSATGTAFKATGAFPIESNPVKHNDSGGASRFFYCAKASRKERGEGNNHPTVKPLKLMEYLCRLTRVPTGGIVLDPFMGSGTTGIASLRTGRNFIGIEIEEDYIKIAEQRISGEREKSKGMLFS